MGSVEATVRKRATGFRRAVLTLGLEGIRRVLCLGAHADDIEIGCGGTLLRLCAEVPDLDVRWVVLSAEGARAAEARAGADRFLADAGQKTVTVGDFRDARFPAQLDRLKDFFADLAAAFEPDLVLTHRREDAHQDHRAVAELTWQAFRSHSILEYEIPKYDGDLGHPNVFVALSRETCRRKVDGLLEAFSSQRDKPWFTEETFRALLRLRGVESKSGTGYAEGFTARKLLVP